MTQRLLDVLRDNGLLSAHLQTRDPRPVSSIGRFDLTNLRLGIEHSGRLVALLIRNPRAGVYIPISQGRWGFLRDAVFLVIARLAHRDRIVHLHGGYFAIFRSEAGPLIRLAMRAGLASVEQAWVLTDGLRGMFDGVVPADRVQVLENAVDDPFPDGVGSAPASTGPLRVLYLSNLLPEKGWADLLEALERVSASGRPPELQIRLVGERSPDVEREIEKRADRLSRRGISVEAPGPRTGAEKSDEYRRADLFVYPTRYRYEGQPLVLLEAMAAGLPIVTTTLGGIPDTVEEGRSALLVSPGDVEQLVRVLDRVLGDPDLRARLGGAARERYLARYTPSRFSEALIRHASPSGTGAA
jgi:glycosyltransferase involved in cell wall biosynthesis